MARMDGWLSVINNTTNLSEGFQLSTIWLQWRPEWRTVSYRYEYNDNRSEGLPVINDTSAKMTFVILFWINTLKNWVVNNQCARWPVWSSSNSMYHWRQRLNLKDWTTTRFFLPWFSSSVPTGLGGFLPIINLSFFLPPKWPCLLLTLHLWWLNRRWLTRNGLTRNNSTRNKLTPNGSDPWWFDLRRLSPVILNESAGGRLLPALGTRRQRRSSLSCLQIGYPPQFPLS